MLAAGVLAAGLWFTWRNLQTTQAKLEVDRQGQVTSRFTAAVELLGARTEQELNIEARLGGIYALARVARDSIEDRWAVVEVLCGYLRHNKQYEGPNYISHRRHARTEDDFERPRADVEAIATFLRTRVISAEGPESGSINLRQTVLRGANLERANLEHAHFVGSDLVGVKFTGARLQNAHFYSAVCHSANFDGADLTDADFTRAPTYAMRAL